MSDQLPRESSGRCSNCAMVASLVFPPGSYAGDPGCPVCMPRPITSEPDPLDELFVANDGGCLPVWVSATGRTCAQAVAMAELVTTIEDGCTVERVYGRIDATTDGPKFTIEEDGDVEMWQVSN